MKVKFWTHWDDQSPEAFPKTAIGLGWNFNWFYSLKLHTLKKTIRFGPSANLYLFLGSKMLTVSVELFLKNE